MFRMNTKRLLNELLCIEWRRKLNLSFSGQMFVWKTRKASSKMATRTRSKAREPAHVHPPAERRARKQTRESIEFSRRKSLAACGTQWETGLRRSTRIRTRPLEYWNGERPLYGRIHDSLVTVVGTKFSRPGKKAGEGAFTVKFYVSDEYKEIVERAALH